MSIEQLTATVEELKGQVAQLQQQVAPYQAPIIHESWYCSYCQNYFYSQNSKLNHRCTDEVERAREQEMKDFNDVLYGVNEPIVHKLNFVTTPEGFSVPEQEAIAMAESKERRKRASLAAHDKAMEITH